MSVHDCSSCLFMKWSVKKTGKKIEEVVATCLKGYPASWWFFYGDGCYDYHPQGCGTSVIVVKPTDLPFTDSNHGALHITNQQEH